MISYGDLFKIFVIIVVIFLVLLMIIYVFRKARDALTNEDRRDKEYRRRKREIQEQRKFDKSMKDRENLMNVTGKVVNSFDHAVDSVGKEAVGMIGNVAATAVKES